MPRYAAFLRGISPVNAKMPELKTAFEAAGFTDVRTVIASGNVVFSTNGRSSDATLQRKAEAAMRKHLGREFLTIVRPIDALRDMLASDPFKAFRVKSNEKRIVTFLRDHPKVDIAMPISEHGARILCRKDREIFTVYLPVPEGAMFMALIERTFGKVVTTRTWDTIAKVVRARETSQLKAPAPFGKTATKRYLASRKFRKVIE